MRREFGANAFGASGDKSMPDRVLKRFSVDVNDKVFRALSKDRIWIPRFLGAGFLTGSAILVEFWLRDPIADAMLLSWIGLSALAVLSLAYSFGEAHTRLYELGIAPGKIVVRTNGGITEIPLEERGMELDLYDFRENAGARFHSVPCGVRIRARRLDLLGGISGDAYDEISTAVRTLPGATIDSEQGPDPRKLSYRPPRTLRSR